MKWSVDFFLLSTEHSTLYDNEEDEQRATDSLCLSRCLCPPHSPVPSATSQPPPRMLFFIQHPRPLPYRDSLRTQTACLATYPPPSSLPGLNAERGSRGCTLAGNRPDQWIFFLSALSARNPTEASAPSHDEPTALPLLHSQEIAVRDYLFWGEPHLFFKWPYLSQIKETLGDNWGWDCFVFFSSGFWNFSVGVIVGLVVHFFCHWGHWASVV